MTSFVGIEDWLLGHVAAWQFKNRRLIREGWTLTTCYMVNGDIEHYAEKDGERVDNNPSEAFSL
jgi:hypothetical protein